MRTIERRITIEYNDEHDVAYVYILPREEAVDGIVKKTLPVALHNPDENVDGSLVIDRDNLDRIIGLEFLGAAGILPPAFLLDPDDPPINWTQPPKSLMRRVRSLTERAAIEQFVENVTDLAHTTARPLDDIIREELRYL